MGNKIQKRDLEEFNKLLPMGYTAESDSNSWSWGEKDNRQYLLLLVVIAIIFFTTSVLFNSLKQPLAIIFVIPVSYIGVFLTFYWSRYIRIAGRGGTAGFLWQSPAAILLSSVFCAVGAGLYACCYCWVSVCPFFCCPTNWKEGENGKLLTIRYSVRIPIRSR